MINFKPGSTININSLPPIKETELDSYAKKIADHNPILWLDASETDRILDANNNPITTDGTAIARWNTKRGFGATFANQGTVSRRPAFKTNQINGRPAVYFNGASATNLLRIDNLMVGNMGRMYKVPPYKNTTHAGNCLCPMAVAVVFRSTDADRQETIFNTGDIDGGKNYNGFILAKNSSSEYTSRGVFQSGHGSGGTKSGGTTNTDWHYMLYVPSTIADDAGTTALYVDGSAKNVGIGTNAYTGVSATGAWFNDISACYHHA